MPIEVKNPPENDATDLLQQRNNDLRVTPKSELSTSPIQALTPAQMLSTLVTRGADPAVLEKFMDLADRWEANEAKKAYFQAVAKFKKNPFVITKDMENKQYKSKYTSKGNLINTVNAELSKYSLTASFDYKQTGEKNATNIHVTCLLTHKDGHRESVTLFAPPDESGAKNPIQQIKSTITYLEIVTYSAVTGTSSAEALDDDGKAVGAAEVKLISVEQANTIHSMLTENGLDLINFLKHVKQESIEKIPAEAFNHCMQEIKGAIKARAMKNVKS